MTSETYKFETPLPGVEMSSSVAKNILAKFRSVFRPAGTVMIPSNIPTACLLRGRKDHNVLNTSQFLKHQTIFFVIEGTHTVIRSARPCEIVNYIKKREPCEDYDICLFDSSFSWCVGITHNDDIVIVENKRDTQDASKPSKRHS